MQPLEFVGDNTEDALQKACEHFDLPLNRLEVEVVTAGSSGFLGLLGAKKAKVLVKPLSGGAKDDVAEVMKELTGGSPTHAQRRAPQPSAAPKAGSEPAAEADSQAQASAGGGTRIEENPEVVDSAKEVLAKTALPSGRRRQHIRRGQPLRHPARDRRGRGGHPHRTPRPDPGGSAVPHHPHCQPPAGPPGAHPSGCRRLQAPAAGIAGEPGPAHGPKGQNLGPPPGGGALQLPRAEAGPPGLAP